MNTRATRWIRSPLALMVILAATLLAGSAEAVAAPAAFNLENVGSRLCLGIHGGAEDSGANAVQGPCATTPTQTWHVRVTTDIDGRQAWQLRNDVGLCLGVAGSGPAGGARVVQETCRSAGDRSQFWLPDTPTFASFQNAHSGKCLGVRDGSVRSGAQIVQLDCGAASLTQKWSVVSA